MTAIASSPFAPEGDFRLDGAAGGPLAGLGVAVKDLFHIAGRRTGAGNPDWLDDHGPATETAPALARLLAAGAHVAGKVLTDELAYSLGGENHHYGTPPNPAAPGRSPGGSSSGSASAVALGLAEIGLGTDTGGSIRVPACWCGLWGLRPSWGAVPAAGLVPLAPRFDTVGWLTRDAETLARVGDILLPPGEAAPPARLLVADSLFALLPASARAALAPALEAIGGEPAFIDPALLAEGAEAFRILQGRDIWRVHGEWITRRKPAFGPGIAERFAWCATLTAEDEARAEQAAARIRPLAPPPGTLLCLPTAPAPAPLIGAADPDLRARLMQLTCLAGLAGAPQLHLPAARLDGLPFGLSLMAAPGCDRSLLAAALSLSSRLPR